MGRKRTVKKKKYSRQVYRKLGDEKLPWIRPRAVYFALFVFVANLIITITATLVGFGIDQGGSTTFTMWVTSVFITILLTGLFTWGYFNGNVPKSALEGLYIGLMILFVGTMIELIIAFSLMAKTGIAPPIELYYFNRLYWIGVVLVIATTTKIGWYQGLIVKKTTIRN